MAVPGENGHFRLVLKKAWRRATSVLKWKITAHNPESISIADCKLEEKVLKSMGIPTFPHSPNSPILPISTRTLPIDVNLCSTVKVNYF